MMKASGILHITEVEQLSPNSEKNIGANSLQHLTYYNQIYGFVLSLDL